MEAVTEKKRILYLDCGMGAAGDMLAAALLELLPGAEQEEMLAKFNALGLSGVEVRREKTEKCGIVGSHVRVTVYGEEESEDVHRHHHEHGQEEHDHDHHHEHDHGEHGHEHHHEHDHGEHGHDHHHEQDHDEHSHDHEEHHHHHHHSRLSDIEQMVSSLPVSATVRRDVLAVYTLIAEAESHVHGKPVREIHFHEVGTLDAVADVTAVCLLMERLAPKQVVASPVHVGSGSVRCAHGVLPVPAPATAYLLRGIPIYGGEISGELCTPTGAALLKHFAAKFGSMPVMSVEAIGYGMGKKDFPKANCVRAMLGAAAEADAPCCDSGSPSPDRESVQPQDDVVYELSCNVDDMTAEQIGFAMERLFDGGALEVYTVPIGMKKSRPGTLLRVMCREEKKAELIELVFRYTTTIGVRETLTRRHVLERKIETVGTPYGEVRRKVSIGYGVTRCKYEYEDLARIARERDIDIEEVREMCNRSAMQQ